MSRISWQTYLAAMAAMNQDNYLSYEGIEEATPEDEGFIDMTAYSPSNPEELMLFKERWFSLRQEARELINIILDCPEEIREEILGTRRRSATRVLMTGAKIVRYLAKKWEDPSAAVDTMREIRQFIQDGVRS